MAKYLLKVNYTVDGLKGVLADGGSGRRKVAEAAANSVGGSIESFYFAFGGTDVFGRFLDRYTIFFLSRIANVRLPGGRPIFPQVPAQTPEAVLAEHGLRDKGCELSDPAARLIISRWERPA